MFGLPVEIITVLTYFAAEFSKPSFENAKSLLTGSILCTGRRCITSILSILGLANDKQFCNYHRFFNRAKYNCCNLSKILLGLLIQLLPKDAPILMVVDDTLERRRGRKITAKGYYRDAIRSTEKEIVKCYGLKWVCMMLLVKLPWANRHWALPVMTVLAPSRDANEKLGKTHKTVNDWTMLMVKVISRWLKREWILVGDGAFACIKLAWACIHNNVHLVSRLRLDAALFEFPVKPDVPQSGRPKGKGARAISLAKLAKDDSQNWQTSEVPWYGGKTKVLKILTGVNLWYTAGEKPLPVRWVLTFDPEKDHAEAFFSTNLKARPVDIIHQFVLRWNIEVTFEEARAHLGFETQRQWSERAIARTTPLLLGLFSLVCLFAKEMIQHGSLPVISTAWYTKGTSATFSDVIAYVRRAIWSNRCFAGSGFAADTVEISKVQAQQMIESLCRAA